MCQHANGEYQVTGLLSGNFHVELVCPECHKILQDVTVASETEHIVVFNSSMKLVADRGDMRIYSTEELCVCGEWKYYIVFDSLTCPTFCVTAKICKYCDESVEGMAA